MAPRPARPQNTTPEPRPEHDTEWYRFVGDQPVVLVARALAVDPGDVIRWPDGAPDDTNWTPTEAPATEET